MKHAFLFTCACFACTCLFAQSPQKAVKKLGNDPLFFMDSVYMDKKEIGQYDPSQIASVTVFKGGQAVALLGEEGRDGIVYIETKPFARKRYWRYFSSKSADYRQLIPTPESDTAAQYILNGHVLGNDFEGNLASIDDKVLKSITMADRATLEKQYGVTGKAFGVVIQATVPDYFYKKKKKS